MTTWGVRLYEIELARGRGVKAQPFVEKTADGEWSYRDYAHRILAKKVGKPQRGLPLSPDADPPTPQELREKPVVALLRIEKKGRHTLGELDYGRTNGHDKAIPHPDVANQDALDITDYAPTRPYRFALIIPESGTVGILAVESISGACPARYIVQWLRKWSMDDAAKKDSKSPLPNGKVRPWWRLRAEPIGDPKQLMNFIDESEAESMVLVHRRVTGGRLRKDEKFRVEAQVQSGMSGKVMKAVQDAIRVKAGDGGMAKELAALLGDELQDVDFDDGWVVIDTELGLRQVSPSRLPDVFTYPVANYRPTDKQFLDETSLRAKALMSEQAATLKLTDL